MVKVTVDHHQSNTGLEAGSFLSKGICVLVLHMANEDDGVLLSIVFNAFMPSHVLDTYSFIKRESSVVSVAGLHGIHVQFHLNGCPTL
jgi:hypothetical protein